MRVSAGLAATLAAGVSASTASAAVVINEFVANHVGTDTMEYVELYGTPSTSLASYRVLQIEGDGTSAGIIDSVDAPTALDGFGFWWTGFKGDRWENGTMTLLLVQGFTGSVGTDLDTNNDGVLDLSPWTSVDDGVGINDGGGTDRNYTGVVLTASFDGGSFTPGGASRIPNGVDTNTVGDWMRNDFDLAGILTGTPDPGEAYNTPNARNVKVPAPGAALLGLAGLVGLRRRR